MIPFQWKATVAAARMIVGVGAAASSVQAQKSPLTLPPIAGVSMVQTLSTPNSERESVHTVADADARGLRWTWEAVEVGANNDTSRSQFRYAELHADIRDAFRLRAYHERDEPEEHPGYSMHALSRAVYRRLRTAGSDSFQVLSIESPPGGILASFAGGRATPVRWRGTISVVTPSPAPFPLLLNGHRVEVPALHVRAKLTVRLKTWSPEFWVLADSAYPLLLKWVGAYDEPTNVLQTIRIDVPGGILDVERVLASSCRVELPGIYFAFNSAVLDAASDRTLTGIADLLVRHPDWNVTLEGHTDSIGTAAGNRTLSEQRVAAVRSWLVARHKVEGTRLKTVGFGSARPRETNASIEGRARNRRVELVRDCARR
jgi:outer membrane protein OmpA-like peptidoglycan-associated protein